MERRAYDRILDAAKDPTFPRDDAADAGQARDIDGAHRREPHRNEGGERNPAPNRRLSRSNSMPMPVERRDPNTSSAKWKEKPSRRYATVTGASMSVHRKDDLHALKTRINKARKSLDKLLSEGTIRSKKGKKLIRLKSLPEETALSREEGNSNGREEHVQPESFFTACSYFEFQNGQRSRKIRSKILQNISSGYFGVSINVLVSKDRRQKLPLVEASRRKNESQISRIKRAWQNGTELRGAIKRPWDRTEADEIFDHVRRTYGGEEPADPYLDVSVAADELGIKVVVYSLEYDEGENRGELKLLWTATPSGKYNQTGELPVCYVAWICGYQYDLLVTEDAAPGFTELRGRFAQDTATEDVRQHAKNDVKGATISEPRDPYPLERIGWSRRNGEQFLEFCMPSTNRQERMTMLPEQARSDGLFETSRSGFSLMGTEHRLEIYKRTEGQPDAMKLDREKKECRDCTVCTLMIAVIMVWIVTLCLGTRAKTIVSVSLYASGVSGEYTYT